MRSRPWGGCRQASGQGRQRRLPPPLGARSQVVNGRNLASWLTIDLLYEAPMEMVVIANGESTFNGDLVVRRGGGGRLPLIPGWLAGGGRAARQAC